MTMNETYPSMLTLMRALQPINMSLTEYQVRSTGESTDVISVI